MAHRPTRQDIADALGVSIITVHRALNDTGYVSQQLRDRIRAQAERMGYRTHRAARGLVRTEPRRLAVFSTEAPAFHWDAVELGVRTAADQIVDFGYEIVYERIPAGDTPAYLERLHAARADGMDAAAVVNNLEYEMERVFALLDDWELPYATLNIDAPTSHRRAFVGVDHTAEARLAANFFAASAGVCARPGSTIALVAAPPRPATTIEGADIASERLSGFRAVLEPFDATVLPVVIGSEQTPDATVAIDQLERIGRRLCGLYLTTIDPPKVSAVVDAARVPVVAGSDSPQISQLLAAGRVAAIVYQNPTLQGYYAVRALEHIVEQPAGRTPERVTLVHSLMLRENMGLPSNHQLFVGDPPWARSPSAGSG